MNPHLLRMRIQNQSLRDFQSLNFHRRVRVSKLSHQVQNGVVQVGPKYPDRTPAHELGQHTSDQTTKPQTELFTPFYKVQHDRNVSVLTFGSLSPEKMSGSVELRTVHDVLSAKLHWAVLY